MKLTQQWIIVRWKGFVNNNKLCYRFELLLRESWKPIADNKLYHHYYSALLWNKYFFEALILNIYFKTNISLLIIPPLNQELMPELNEAIREILLFMYLTFIAMIRSEGTLYCTDEVQMKGLLKSYLYYLTKKPTSGISTSAARSSNKVIPRIRTQGVRVVSQRLPLS